MTTSPSKDVESVHLFQIFPSPRNPMSMIDDLAVAFVLEFKDHLAGDFMILIPANGADIMRQRVMVWCEHARQLSNQRISWMETIGWGQRYDV